MCFLHLDLPNLLWQDNLVPWTPRRLTTLPQWAKDACTQKLIDASTTACATCHSKKDLISWLTNIPATGNTFTAGCSKTQKKNEKKHLPALTLKEQALLDKHVDHKNANCPMKADNTWPDAEMYIILTVPATTVVTEDNETDLYIPPHHHVTPFSYTICHWPPHYWIPH